MRGYWGNYIKPRLVNTWAKIRPVKPIVRPAPAPKPVEIEQPKPVEQPKPEPVDDTPVSVVGCDTDGPPAGFTESPSKRYRTVAEHTRRWDDLVVKGKQSRIDKDANHIITNWDKYKAVEDITGVPAELVGAIHLQEASGNFSKYLGNGQPLSMRTTIVPKGRGPFKDWQSGAIDAMKYELNVLRLSLPDGPWTIGKMLWFAEAYNGAGYFRRKLASPYVYAWSNHHQKGRFVADGVFSPTSVPGNPGVAVVLKRFYELVPKQ